MTAAMRRESRASVPVEKPAAQESDDGMAGEQSAEKAKRDISSKKFEFLRAMMKDTAISPIAYRLACFLIWEYRNEKHGGECFPGIDTLAGDLAVNEKTVRRAIKELVDGRYFTIQRVGKQQSNRYWPIFGDRTQMSAHESASMSDRDDGDRTFGGPVSGHFRRGDRTQMSAESSLEPSLEPRGGPTARPLESSSSTFKGESHSTLKGSVKTGDARPPVASPSSPQQRYHIQEDIVISGIGRCTVVSIKSNHSTRRTEFHLRSFNDGAYLSAPVDDDGYLMEDRLAWGKEDEDDGPSH